MKKTIKINKTNINGVDYYSFYLEDGTFLFNVDCSQKTIKGRDLFEKIYLCNSEEPIEIEINQSELTDDDKKCFGNYVKDVFDSINKSMKQQFAKEENSDKITSIR